MRSPLRFPIRLKIMISLLFGITAVVSVIVFTMANFFHNDKRSYMRDWISIASLNTAEECRTLLDSYMKRLQLSSAIMLNEAMPQEEKERLLQRLFDFTACNVQFISTLTDVQLSFTSFCIFQH